MNRFLTCNKYYGIGMFGQCKPKSVIRSGNSLMTHWWMIISRNYQSNNVNGSGSTGTFNHARGQFDLQKKVKDLNHHVIETQKAVSVNDAKYVFPNEIGPFYDSLRYVIQDFVVFASDITDKNGNLQNLNGQLTEKTKNLQSKIDETVATMNKQVKELDDNIVELKNNNLELQDSNYQLNEKLNDQKNVIFALEMKLKNSNDEKTQLINDKNELTKNVNNLKTEIGATTNKLQTTEKLLYQTQTHKENSKTEIERLKKENELKASKLNGYDSMKTDMAKLQERLENVTKTTKSLKISRGMWFGVSIILFGVLAFVDGIHYTYKQMANKMGNCLGYVKHYYGFMTEWFFKNVYVKNNDNKQQSHNLNSISANHQTQKYAVATDMNFNDKHTIANQSQSQMVVDVDKFQANNKEQDTWSTALSYIWRPWVKPKRNLTSTEQ